ncbi:uncharacterized protein [Nicotiana tomentosiformis]|uniref:uncharacterized protein n=1 Tax=Nicotiana tomentosiformis TaxID=4098 RepID=UPI00388CCC9A
MGYIDGAEKCPPQFLTTTDGSVTPNPAYKIWTRHNSLLRNAIMAFVDCTIVPFIANTTTSAIVWQSLHTTYANKSQAQIFGLWEQLSTLRRNSRSIADFIGEIKSLADNLAATGSPLTSEELTIKVFSGLGPEYKKISAAIRARDIFISFEELYDKLLGHEVFSKHENAKKEQLTITAQLNQRSSSNNRPRDVWGTSPILSFDKARYYVVFVDHFTKYSWLFTLKIKSDITVIFDNFKNQVERYFNTSSRSVYSIGGDYVFPFTNYQNTLPRVNSAKLESWLIHTTESSPTTREVTTPSTSFFPDDIPTVPANRVPYNSALASFELVVSPSQVTSSPLSAPLPIHLIPTSTVNVTGTEASRPEYSTQSQTFPLLVPASQTLLSNQPASSLNRPLDVNNAFLQGSLHDTTFMKQPQGFVVHRFLDHVCLLKKAIYGLHQAPRAWYMELRSYLLSSGFNNAHSDTSLFTYHCGNSQYNVQSIISKLASLFSLKDLGSLHYFLGVEVTPYNGGLILTQHKYIFDILERHNMLDAKGVSTPLSSSSALSLNDGSAPTDAKEYRRAIGTLQYLSLTGSDICFATNKLAQFMHSPTVTHWQAVKRLLKYLKHIITYGLHFNKSSSLSLTSFSDADWTGSHDDRMSTIAYLIFLGSNPISSSSKKQRTVARLSTKSEYKAVAITIAEINWLSNLLHELSLIQLKLPVVYCDNIGATYLCKNLVFHSRMKHVAIDFYFVRGQVSKGEIVVKHIPTGEQVADPLIKALPKRQFFQQVNKIGLLSIEPILRGMIRVIQILIDHSHQHDPYTLSYIS